MNKNTHLLGLTGLLILLALWQIGSLILAHSMPLANMLAPAAALGSLKTLLLDGNLWAHIGASLQRVGVGLLAALVIGVPIGFALGLSRKVEQAESVFSVFAYDFAVVVDACGGDVVWHWRCADLFFVGVCGGVVNYFEYGFGREKHQSAMARIGAFVVGDPIGNVV